MRTVPARHLVPLGTRQRVLTPASPEFATHGLLTVDAGGRASGAWFSANDPVAIPFALSTALLVAQLGWINGSSAGGNVDIGIYDTNWNRIVAAGSTAGAGTDWQRVDVTDTWLAPGRYYLAYVRDNTTANRTAWYATLSSVNLTSFCGLQDSATNAFPLPDPLTNMALAQTVAQIPVIGIWTRAPF